jgi:hypothetical protein
MNLGLVLRLKTADEVPESLREEFLEIARLAEG